jgi:hypothetical protein
LARRLLLMTSALSPSPSTSLAEEGDMNISQFVVRMLRRDKPEWKACPWKDPPQEHSDWRCIYHTRRPETTNLWRYRYLSDVEFLSLLWLTGECCLEIARYQVRYLLRIVPIKLSRT